MKCCYCGIEHDRLIKTYLLSKFTVRDIKAVTGIRPNIEDESNIIYSCSECNLLKKYSENYPTEKNYDLIFKFFPREKILKYSYFIYQYKDIIKRYLEYKVEESENSNSEYASEYYTDKLNEFNEFITDYETEILNQ